MLHIVFNSFMVVLDITSDFIMSNSFLVDMKSSIIA